MYLISCEWVNEWKKYVDYERTSEENEPESALFGRIEIPKINEDIVIKEEGALESADINYYGNQWIKPGLIYGLDFLYISRKGWNYIFMEYNEEGYEVKRPKYKTDREYKVEAHLLKVYLKKKNNFS